MTTSSSVPSRNDAYFSSICIDSCGGRCCDPWWGIVSFTLKKTNGLKKLDAFREEVVSEIQARSSRIRNKYITSETPSRPLLTEPLRYNVTVENITVAGSTLNITLRALFAFKCLFLTDDKSCDLHPAILGGKDIRPPHCGYMGTPTAEYGEKGFCRIIGAATDVGASKASVSVEEAIELEARSSKTHFNEGESSAKAAADKVINRIVAHCKEFSPELLKEKETNNIKTGRNDPCTCGSGKKYKKCCGR